MIKIDQPESWRECYPAAPCRLAHELGQNPLLTIQRLADLTVRLPNTSIEYNSSELPVGHDPAKTPKHALSAEQTVRDIVHCKSWVAIKNIEQDPQYCRLLDDCLDQLEVLITPVTGRMHQREAFIFVSSPGAVTPFHMDPEHNILMQISGAKTMYVFSADDTDIVSSKQHEIFHGEGGHRNLKYDQSFDCRATYYELAPGDALYVPVKAPHWVRVEDTVSVSLSITWRSELSDREAQLRRANAWLRARGANPPRPGEAPMHDQAKILAQRIVSRFG